MKSGTIEAKCIGRSEAGRKIILDKRKWITQHIQILFFVIILLVVIISGLALISSNQTKYKEQLQQKQALEKERMTAQLELEGTKRTIEYARNNEYLERLARKMFRWVEDDEVIYQDTSSTATPSERENNGIQ